MEFIAAAEATEKTLYEHVYYDLILKRIETLKHVWTFKGIGQTNTKNR